MLSPSPLPSPPVRERSPRTKRSVSSSPVMFSGSLEMLRKVTNARPSFTEVVRYTRVPGRAYFTMFVIRLENTRQSSCPSARILGCSLAAVSTGSSCFCRKRSVNSPAA